MSEFKGTPGPWVASEDWDNHECITIYSDTGIQPHVCYTPEFTCDDEIANANAQLIAAAPDLLYGLKIIKSELLRCDILDERLEKFIDELVAKAVGRGKSC